MTDTATLTARLQEAETALHRLRMGATAVEVRHDDVAVKYAPADLGQLAAYVRDLKRQLGLTSRGRAIGVGFR